MAHTSVKSFGKNERHALDSANVRLINGLVGRRLSFHGTNLVVLTPRGEYEFVTSYDFRQYTDGNGSWDRYNERIVWTSSIFGCD